MVQKMSGHEGISANALSKEEGVSQTALSRWLRDAGTMGEMKKRDKRRESGSRGTEESRRPQDWPLEEKLRVIVEASKLKEEELGEFLRREGLHKVQLDRWRQEASGAFGEKRMSRTSRREDKKRIKELEREVRRKDKALAEAAALLVLKKKAQAIWGGEEDDTGPRRGK